MTASINRESTIYRKNAVDRESTVILESTVAPQRPGGAPAGAASTAHPLATEAALAIMTRGGSAVDAAIAAQAVICTVMPQAGGLGGDLLALVHEPDGTVHAVNGTGKSPARAPADWSASGGGAVTVPGLVDGWRELHDRWGRLPLSTDLAAAASIALDGYTVDRDLLSAVDDQRDRLLRHGAAEWSLLDATDRSVWRQPELAEVLRAIGEDGPAVFYAGDPATHLANAVRREGGSLEIEDLASHRTETPPAIGVGWDGGQLWVQPPSSQGVILAMAAQWLEAAAPPGRWQGGEHVLVEATEAAFVYRDQAAAVGAGLLAEHLEVNPERADHRGGPRGYLHTAGVAVADRSGLVVSSLVSVFDDFGSAVFVPELGLVLNNRAAGFTSGANSPRPGARPVHTLAPALRIDRNGNPLALATPGADGQVQTLLQVLVRLRADGTTLDDALGALRWRSENGRVLIERGHAGWADLVRRGHRLTERAPNDAIFGAVVAAGLHGGEVLASADPRRNVTRGVR